MTSESGQYNIDYENYPNDYLVVTISQTLFNRFEDDIMVYKHLAFNPETQFGYIFSEKYGWIDYQRINIGGTWSRTYLGCYINAIAYGDTSFNQNK